MEDFRELDKLIANARKAQEEYSHFSQEQVDVMFGDSSVKLPPTLTRPDWPSEVILPLEFGTPWRAWQAKIGYDPPEDAP